MRSSLSLLVAGLLVALLAAGCPGRGPSDEEPEGAVLLFLESLKRYDGPKAFDLLAPDSRAELERRATTASRQAGRRIEPWEMLVLERFVMRWEVARTEPREQGDEAVVTLLGEEPSQRAEVELRRVDGRWRVVLPLPR